MYHLLRLTFTPLVGALLLSVACTPGNAKSGSGGNPTGGGGRGGGGTAGSGGTGAADSGGAAGGGTSPGSGGRGSGGTAGSGGTGVAGSGGNAGSGGASLATGGRGSGGTAGSGGSGAAGSGGVAGPGSGGAATGGASAGFGGKGVGGAGNGGAGSGGSIGGSSGTGGDSGTGGVTVAAGDDYVSDVKVAVHPNTNTILVVTWTQLKAADKTLLEFNFLGGNAMMSRALAGATGAHRDVVLGVPEKTAVTLRIVSKVGSVDYKTKDYQGTTGALPSGLPRAEVLAYDVTLASPEKWMLGAVENSPGGCADPSCYYIATFWIYIMDRQGRMVWYWADAADNASSAYPRVARDGEYLVIDKGRQGKTGVVKTTLDRQYYQFVAIPDLDDAMDVTSDGSVLYDVLGDLHELSKAGQDRTLWSCRKAFPSFENCYSNTVNWNAANDTVMLSFPDDGTAVEIDRKTGTIVGQYGNAAGSYAFSQSSWKFQYPHSPNITAQGTLIVSTHLPAYPFGSPPGPKQHAFAEFQIDRGAKRLTEKWVYSDGTEWAMFKGYAIRLANGNTLGNYGTGGVIREVTPAKKTAFHVKFGVTPGDGYDNKMVGNNVYVDDLYALNGGGPK